uniref:Uncharacterized protein n=1 Tax=Manihot esculenta TaxID=3983 RepID=A0A2C9VVD8_MANES
MDDKQLTSAHNSDLKCVHRKPLLKAICFRSMYLNKHNTYHY